MKMRTGYHEAVCTECGAKFASSGYTVRCPACRVPKAARPIKTGYRPAAPGRLCTVGAPMHPCGATAVVEFVTGEGKVLGECVAHAPASALRR